MAKVSSFVPPLHRFWFKKLIGRTLWYGNDNLASQIKRVYSFVLFRFLDHNFHGHIYFPLSVSLYFSVSISGQRKKPTQQGKHREKDINTLNNLKWSWKCSSRSIGSIFWFINQSFGVWFIFCLLQMEYCFFFLFYLWQTLRFAIFRWYFSMLDRCLAVLKWLHTHLFF